MFREQSSDQKINDQKKSRINFLRKKTTVTKRKITQVKIDIQKTHKIKGKINALEIEMIDLFFFGLLINNFYLALFICLTKYICNDFIYFLVR